MEQSQLVFPLRKCGHCGREDVGSKEAGFSGISVADGRFIPLCHPNEAGRPDCYTLTTGLGPHTLPCEQCRVEGAEDADSTDH